MSAMSKEQVDRFLKRPLIAKIATLLHNGSPTITPIWFEWNPKSRTFLLWARKGYGGLNAGWYDNLRRKSRVALLVDESSEINPKHDRVLAIGRAKPLPTPKNWLELQLRMTRRYCGKAKTREYLRSMPKAPGGWVRIIPNRIISWTEAGNINIWHQRYLRSGGRPVYGAKTRNR
jgi:nitroimidazol reductase NimA-like FMN-containing flavoprotein (pyridoxamine 5'-phosphate oxidase superfamily)